MLPVKGIIADDVTGCVSAWKNKDPVFGVIGISKDPSSEVASLARTETPSLEIG
jgi:hypothetical protein